MGTIKGTRMGRLDVPAIGICFHHYYAANSNQRDQLKRIRDLGYEVINTEESPVEPASSPGPLPPVMAWNHIEIGKDKYDWSFHDHLVEDCQAAGLKLITDVFMFHHLPEWVAQKYGDTDVIQPNGRRWGRFQRPLCAMVYEMRCFCLAHEGAVAAAADFQGKLAARYKGSETVVGHNLFQELGMNWPHSSTWYGQDVSPPAISGFEKFLQRKYASLDELNRDWRRNYSSFAQAAGDPAKFRWDGQPYRGWQLWIEYRGCYTTKFLRAMHDAVKASDPEALTTLSGATGSAVYGVFQGPAMEQLGFIDMVAEKSFDDFGAQDGFRFMYADVRTSGTDVAMSNVNTSASCTDITARELGRRVLASVGMGSKWNALYGWHWFTHLDKEKGVRVAHDNIKEFKPWIGFLGEHRSMLAQARPPKAEVAVLAPGFSDIVMFWRLTDPRTGYLSHARRTTFFGAGDTIDYARDILGAWSTNYDIVPPEQLADRLKDYKLLIVGEHCIQAALAKAIQAWMDRGGKLVLLPNAARFDEYGNTVDWFGEKLPQQNVAIRFYREYIGWEKDAAFPAEASVLLLERLDGNQLGDIFKWAGVAPVLSFIDPPTPSNIYPLGASREAEMSFDFFWRDHVSAYSLEDPQGKRMYVLVQRGKETGPVKELPIAWSGGAVTMYQPPKGDAVKVAPAGGKLVLPEWRDVAILVC